MHDMQLIERSSGEHRNHYVCLSVCLSVQIRVQPFTFFLVWHWLTIFGTWVYHHQTICGVHLWSQCNIDLWGKGQIYRVYDTALCSGHNFFVLWHISHTVFGKWVYHHVTMCCIHSWLLYDLDLSLQCQNYNFTMILSLARLSLLFEIGIPNFGIWVYHHETNFCVNAWPLTYRFV